MKTVLYEDKINYRLMTFWEIKKECELNTFKDKTDEEVMKFIDTTKDRFSIIDDKDEILNWCNKVFDSLKCKDSLSQVERDRRVRQAYFDLRKRYIGSLESGNLWVSQNIRGMYEFMLSGEKIG